MTIIASVKVRDGIVLATDSMSQLTIKNDAGQIGVIKAYSNARKLFQIKDLAIGVMSYGLGNIGTRSMESLVLEFSRGLHSSLKRWRRVEDVSKKLHKFISDIYNEAFQAVPIDERRKHLRLGFFIGGYSHSKYLADEWEFELPDVRPLHEVRAEDKLGSSWRGIPIPFERLYNGFDRRVVDALKKEGVEDKILQEVFQVEKWRMPIAYDGMPVQDAINFATYILNVTIGAATFELGTAPTCGGPLQIAAILPDRGWQWIQEPELEMA